MKRLATCVSIHLTFSIFEKIEKSKRSELENIYREGSD